ncbi:hypothetical protein SY89_02615 [Halolamina pelagica]|uniref:Metal-binding protein n=1 Tax=Halolamina pelagica TaxID=699431 RepID=A0A0N8I0B7_9EURY|nr:UPF0058 family protein [Halolamina pelagica]KPN31859.1 hypothetical protein SY89_02615 [Halolamina pelagica]
MKKQELIHLHGLLAELQSQFDAAGETVSEEYRELGVQPTSIHRSKTDHKAAVFALIHGVTDELEGDENTAETEAVTATAD